MMPTGLLNLLRNCFAIAVKCLPPKENWTGILKKFMKEFKYTASKAASKIIMDGAVVGFGFSMFTGVYRFMWQTKQRYEFFKRRVNVSLNMISPVGLHAAAPQFQMRTVNECALEMRAGQPVIIYLLAYDDGEKANPRVATAPPHRGAQSHRSARAALPDAPRPAVGPAGPASKPAGRVQGVQAVASAADQDIRNSQPSLA